MLETILDSPAMSLAVLTAAVCLTWFLTLRCSRWFQRRRAKKAQGNRVQEAYLFLDVVLARKPELDIDFSSDDHWLWEELITFQERQREYLEGLGFKSEDLDKLRTEYMAEKFPEIPGSEETPEPLAVDPDKSLGLLEVRDLEFPELSDEQLLIPVAREPELVEETPSAVVALEESHPAGNPAFRRALDEHRDLTGVAPVLEEADPEETMHYKPGEGPTAA